MAHYTEHCADCERLLGRDYGPVHVWLDEMFRRVGPRHRKFRHHMYGVATIEEKFGWDAAKAAVVHIVRDCGGVPFPDDYATGKVDFLGTGRDCQIEVLYYDGLNQKALDKLRVKVEEEWAKYGAWRKLMQEEPPPPPIGENNEAV